ncbi:aldehyde dehydrogenase family protein [Sphingomonas sp. CGMCC 1.13654]|uniref:Aldehyde dehydrogenase family protein n=1 Tax=Sphingomonas chungangi TaxID=2683589 RepID=A0A838L3D0_9SPHN|nr:aldehyde dehydrogenase family protein [Sphingomonas chungangi]MBA2933567.1 aldehyde dehydrogenase family protein [Sphingomonas chungangi]MVW54900.1 aldehyde dehydrogenase family protein [Sphingomonas chungangi]
MQSSDLRERVVATAEAASTLLIDGQWRGTGAGASFASINPATGESMGNVSEGDPTDVDAAVRAARIAFEDRRWIGLPYPMRAKILFDIASRIEAEAEQLAINETRENGMPIAMARMTIANGAQAFRYFGGWIGKIHGQTGEIGVGDAFFGYTLKEPVGVAALIVPWNGPFMLACHKLAPALAAGCSVVVKPAEDTSLNTVNLVRIAMDAGVPAGVVNMVTGFGPVVGQALADHPDVDKISFTGSTATGRRLIAASVGNLKRLSLELGGKSPVIVLDDADIETAAPAILGGIMSNSGQACHSGSRLYAQRGIYDRLIRAVSDLAQKLVVGDGMDERTQMGPVISQRQFDTVMSYIDSGVADGAEIAIGGKRRGTTGYFIEPTILSHAPADATVVREEIFGPVLSAMPFDDLDWAIAEANRSRYGLAGAVYTTSLSKAHTVARAIRAGTIWINTHRPTEFWTPFGGYKESGWGREGGAEGIGAFLETKSVIARLA